MTTDLRRLAEQRAPNNHTASHVNYRDGKAILALLDRYDGLLVRLGQSGERAKTAESRVAALEAERERTRDSLHAVFGEKERLVDRVAALEELARDVEDYCNDPQLVEQARPLLRCDRIVNNGMSEPTECGRTLPCEMHDPAAPSEPEWGAPGQSREQKKMEGERDPAALPAEVERHEVDSYGNVWPVREASDE